MLKRWHHWGTAVLLLLLGTLLLGCGGGNEVQVGADAPEFTLPDAGGGEVSLAEYEGQPVLLYFHMAVG